MTRVIALLQHLKQRVLGDAPPASTSVEGPAPAKGLARYQQGLVYYEQGIYAESIPHFLASLEEAGLTWPPVWRVVTAALQTGTLDQVAASLRSLADASRFDKSELQQWLKEAISNAAQPLLKLKRIKFAGSALDPSLLREFAQKFQTDVFVETGTFMGDTAATAATIFREVHTIELSAELYERAKARFADTPNVFVHQGDSSVVLAELLPTLQGRVLFWLDGHYSEGITARGAENTPILGELRAVNAAADKGSVVLIDDLRLFQVPHPTLPESMHGYPTVEHLRQEAYQLFEQPTFVVYGDTALAFDSSRHASVTVSPVLEACTISRMETAPPIEQLLSAEAVIAAAEETERETLQALHQDYAASEAFGLGGHYRLWNGLILLQAREPGPAQAELERALTLGCNHWRVLWYLAQGAARSGDVARAAWWLRRLLAVTADFQPAEALWTTLEGTNPDQKASRWVSRTVPRLDSTVDSLANLERTGAWRASQGLRLHLGCGEQHFAGYINIDHPPSEHSVQQPRADVYADLLTLSFQPDTVDEIRSHHVFEHFDRQTALGLLIRWHEWLKLGGVLHLETPDMLGTSKTLVSDAPYHIKQAVLRHAFGSHEAKWAYHLDGWYPEKFQHVLSQLGFSVECRSWQWDREPYLSNVEAIATKTTAMSRQELIAAAETILRDSMVADVQSERDMLGVWMEQLIEFLDGSVAQAPAKTLP